MAYEMLMLSDKATIVLDKVDSGKSVSVQALGLIRKSFSSTGCWGLGSGEPDPARTEC